LLASSAAWNADKVIACRQGTGQKLAKVHLKAKIHLAEALILMRHYLSDDAAIQSSSLS
jgi:hypothetical protein